MNPNLCSASYPKETGIYIMKDAAGKVLYVGKAKNIQSRLKQYFSKTDLRPQIAPLLSRVDSIETLLVPTEKEALILENNLIKKYQPRYNILLKDDKTYVSLLLSKHRYPRLSIMRLHKNQKTRGELFGPYTSARAAREVFDLVLSLFPLRQCSDAELINRTRPCVLFEMKKCLAPCCEKCTQNEYDVEVADVAAFLKGQNKKILISLKKEMKAASEKLQFEKAKLFLERIQMIEHIVATQHVQTSSLESTDALGLYHEGNSFLIAKLLYREGKLIASEHFSFSNILSKPDELLESFLLQHYLEHLPKKILLPYPIDHHAEIEEILSSKQQTLKLLSPQKGSKKELIAIANQNAKSLFAREKELFCHFEKLLLSLQEELFLTRFPKKIVCFDIAHTQGKQVVGSMVTFIDGKKEKNKTRLFHVKTEEKGDVPTLRHILRRALVKEKELPDLLLLDGARGQLNAALDVLSELNIISIDAAAIAKEEGRHDRGLRAEKIFLATQKEPLLLPPTSPLLFFLQKIRDEAHRVAISFHRKSRQKNLTQTLLGEIKGIGPLKKKLLLTHFKSIENLKKASKEELQSIRGLTKKDLENLQTFFKR
jgi:excinuclease ABC subunit C